MGQWEIGLQIGSLPESELVPSIGPLRARCDGQTDLVYANAAGWLYRESTRQLRLSAPEHGGIRFYQRSRSSYGHIFLETRGSGSGRQDVYSKSLETVSTRKTCLEREFDPQAVRDRIDSRCFVGGPIPAAHAIRTGFVDQYHILVVPVILCWAATTGSYSARYV